MNLKLSPFETAHASVVAAWVRDARELLWLAPRTPPPPTPAKVLCWCGPRCSAYVMSSESDPTIRGYGEINRMKQRDDHAWLGHIILRPDLRGTGEGTRFVQLLVDHVFLSGGTERILLIVFPANVAAIRCYLACGFTETKREFHTFQSNTRQEMVRMTLTREMWQGHGDHQPTH